MERLYDYGELRIKEMDEAGIDLQVISHGPPGTQRVDADTAVKLATGANDLLKNVDTLPSMTKTETYEEQAKDLFKNQPANMQLLVVN